VANTEQMRDRPREVNVAVSADGHYAVNRTALQGRGVNDLASALQAAAQAGGESILIISADAMAPHQSVITVMEAARRVGLSQVTFATQSSGAAPR